MHDCSDTRIDIGSFPSAMNALPQVQTPPASLLHAQPEPQPAAPFPAAPHAGAGSPATRVTFFLLPLEREQIPVWVFVPPDVEHGTAALVVNLSEQGIQVFTPPGVNWGTGLMRLHLLEGADGPAPLRRCSARVQRLWRRTISHSGDLHGLVFVDPDAAAERYLRQRRPEPLARNWVRCVIEPLPAAG